jgi:hypothetical protein
MAEVSAEAARESADAARESARAERDSVEAMAMPYVIATPIPVARVKGNEYDGNRPREIHRMVLPSDGRSTLRLCLWNLGSGPGIVTNVRLVRPGESYLQKLSSDIPIAANDFFDADIRVAGWPPTPTKAVLQIEYLHSNGRLYRTDSDVTIEEDMLRCYTFRRSLAEEPGGG